MSEKKHQAPDYKARCMWGPHQVKIGLSPSQFHLGKVVAASDAPDGKGYITLRLVGGVKDVRSSVFVRDLRPEVVQAALAMQDDYKANTQRMLELRQEFKRLESKWRDLDAETGIDKAGKAIMRGPIRDRGNKINNEELPAVREAFHVLNKKLLKVMRSVPAHISFWSAPGPNAFGIQIEPEPASGVYPHKSRIVDATLRLLALDLSNQKVADWLGGKAKASGRISIGQIGPTERFTPVLVRGKENSRSFGVIKYSVNSGGQMLFLIGISGEKEYSVLQLLAVNTEEGGFGRLLVTANSKLVTIPDSTMKEWRKGLAEEAAQKP